MSFWWIIQVAIGFAFLCGGLDLVWRGWPRRVGTEPSCAGCGYSLLNLESNRCPECGRHRMRGVLLGKREWNDRRLFVGGALIAAALLWGVGPFYGFLSDGLNWRRLVPTSLLIHQLQSDSIYTVAFSARELNRRQLSAEQENEILALAVARLSTAPTAATTDQLVDVAGTWCATGNAPKTMSDAFYSKLVRTQLTVRPKIILGDPVFGTFAVGETIPWLAAASNSTTHYSVDGTVVQAAGGATNDLRLSRPANPLPLTAQPIASPLYATTFSIIEPCHSVSRHELSMVDQIRIYTNSGYVPTGRLIYKEDRLLSASFEVVEKSTEGSVKLDHAPELAAAVQACLSAEILPGGARWQPYLEIESINPPGN